MTRKLQGAALQAHLAKGPPRVHWRKDDGYAWCGAPVGRCSTGEGRGKATVVEGRGRVTCQACLGNHDNRKGA